MSRAAGFNERRCIARDSLGLYGTIVTVGTYRSNIEGSPLSIGNIFKALKQCTVWNPMLAAVIRGSGTEHPQLEVSSTLDLTRHVRQLQLSRTGTEHMQSLLEQIHNETLDEYEDRPQWRIYVVPASSDSGCQNQEFEIAFAASHAYVDGKSALIFHRSLVRALQNVAHLPFDDKPEWVLPPEHQNLLPPLEKAAELVVSWSFFLKNLVTEILPPWTARAMGVAQNTNGVHVWSGSPQRPNLPMQGELIPTAVEVAFVPRESVQRLLVRCRENGSRLTGLLNHLTVRALFRALHSRSQSYNAFKVDTAIDLRRCIPAAKDAVSNYISGVSETIVVETTQDSGVANWAAIQQTTQLLGAASNTLVDHRIALLKYLSSIRSWIANAVKTPADSAFGMSNLGIFDSSAAEDSWSIDEMVFSQSANATAAAMDVNVVSAKGGALSIVVSWWPGMLGIQDERQFIKDICVDIVDQAEKLSFPVAQDKSTEFGG